MNCSRLLLSLFAAFALSCTTAALADETPAPEASATESTSPAATTDTPQSVVVVGSPNSAEASENKSWYKSIWDTAGNHLSDLWTKGDVEVFVPFWTYHMPFAYSPEKRASYTEYPAGGGLGRGWYNKSGNWEGVFAMEFADSHGKPQYQAGYGWIATWRPIDEKFRVGAGVTAFLFMRSDIGNYAPIPGILPVVSTGYGPFDVQMAYIPGGQGNGNVLFWWAKYSFK